MIFSDDWWEKATPVEWPPEMKQEYLLAVWDDLFRGADATWATDAARAADAS